jgi:hypothetical protein
MGKGEKAFVTGTDIAKMHPLFTFEIPKFLYKTTKAFD